MNKNYFKTDRRESAVDIVVNHIKQLLIERRLRPGDRLPNELEISETMGVSRGSVREAMKILSAFGLIDVRVGNGTFVSDTPGNTMIDSFLFSFFITNPNIIDMYEFRQILEVDVLQLIMKHRDKNGDIINEMRKNISLLKAYAENDVSADTMLENDMEFHRLMGQASCNLLMERVYNFTMDFMKTSIEETHKRQHGEYIYASHKKILDVIETNDVTRIEEVITASVNTWRDRQQYAND